LQIWQTQLGKLYLRFLFFVNCKKQKLCHTIKKNFSIYLEEQLEIVEALWDHIDEKLLNKRMSGSKMEKELDKRLDNLKRNPKSLIPWEVVKKEMNKR
jgi:putative addiction module component (TIGR02574 family)